MRRVLAVTGIRSEYDLLRPALKAIDNHPDLEIAIAVTGAHLSRSYGLTVEQIRRDGFPIVEEIESLINGDTKSARLRGAALQLLGLAQTVSRINPDFLMVVGDREESITVAMVGTYLDVPVVHLAGGDKVIGNVDDVIRHAVTKLAHVHLVTNEDSKERVLRLGEQEFRVHNVGNPGLDRFLEIQELSRKEIFEYFGFDNTSIESPLLVVVQHVISSEAEHSYEQMRESLEAIKLLGWPTVLSSPNSDAGSHGLIRCIEEYSGLNNLRVFKNVPSVEFVNLLRLSACLIGNSSLGILEAPFLKLPAINVGNRQKGRLHGDNVVFVKHERAEIVRAVKNMVEDAESLDRVKNGASPYGDGHSSARIADILAKLPIDRDLLIKEITY